MVVDRKGQMTEAALLVSKYQAGYYPEYGREKKPLFWERRDKRAVILLNEESVARAKRLRKKVVRKNISARQYVLKQNTDFGAVLAALGDERLKTNTWVRDEIAEIFQTLYAAGHVRTVEAYLGEELVGGLLGLQFGRAFLVETTFYTKKDASKLCLIEVVEKHSQIGISLIDGQNPHHPMHPAARLGEIVIPIQKYLSLLQQAVQSTQDFHPKNRHNGRMHGNL